MDIEKLVGANIGQEIKHIKKLELKNLGGHVSECPVCIEGRLMMRQDRYKGELQRFMYDDLKEWIEKQNELNR